MPMADPIQWHCGYDVKQKMKAPRGTKTPPPTAKGAKRVSEEASQKAAEATHTPSTASPRVRASRRCGDSSASTIGRRLRGEGVSRGRLTR